MVQRMAVDCRTVALKQRSLVPGLQYVILWRYENEVTQTEQKGYRSQCDYWDPRNLPPLLDMGRCRISGPGMRSIRTVYVSGFTLRKEQEHEGGTDQRAF